jgi:hypothetical protein
VKDSLHAIVLGVLLVIAAALRLYALGEGLWLDEVLTLVTYARLPFAEIATRYDSQNQHMLYSLLAHASFVMFGESAWALRLPAAAFGVASIYAAYLFGREITSRTESLLAAALLTFSFHHIWFSQNARGYTALLFFTLLSSYFLLKALRTSGVRLWTLYALAVAFGMYTHLTMMFVVAGQFLLFIAERLRVGWRREVWIPVAAGFGLSVVLTLALYAPVLGQVLGPGMSEETHVAMWLSPLWTIKEAIARLQFGSGLGVAVLFGGGVLLAGFISLIRRRPALFALFVGPVVTGVAVTVAMNHALWPRFFFFAAGFAMLVLVRGTFATAELAMKLIGRRALNAELVATAATVLIIGVSTFALARVYGPKQDYVGAREFVSRSAASEDSIATAGLASLVYGNYYAPQWSAVTSADDLRTLQQRGRVWFVVTMPLQLDAKHPDVAAELRENFETLKEFHGTLGGGEVVVYRSKGARGVRSEHGSETAGR